jgi:hypothetical protein
MRNVAENCRDKRRSASGAILARIEPIGAQRMGDLVGDQQLAALR